MTSCVATEDNGVEDVACTVIPGVRVDAVNGTNVKDAVDSEVGEPAKAIEVAGRAVSAKIGTEDC